MTQWLLPSFIHLLSIKYKKSMACAERASGRRLRGAMLHGGLMLDEVIVAIVLKGLVELLLSKVFVNVSPNGHI